MNVKPTWLQAEQLRDDPAIEDAITNFAHDQTGDNATGIVLAVLEHAAAAEVVKHAALVKAVEQLIKAKGRFHTEQNYKAVVEAYDALKERS